MEFFDSYPFYRFEKKFEASLDGKALNDLSLDSNKIIYLNQAKNAFSLSMDEILLFKKRYYFHERIIQRSEELGLFKKNEYENDIMAYEKEKKFITTLATVNDKLLSEFINLYQSFIHE
jgi:hypothetical protein